jgi:hypothetical protein
VNLTDRANQLRLDDLAVRVCALLEANGVPHVLIKGPTTTAWLYPEGRRYSDVDVLVPVSQHARAAVALTRSGLATQRSGRVGEQAPHSLVLHSREGFEIDLHRSLPSVPVRPGDGVWDALHEHVTALQLDLGVVKALDVPGRCLVLALHAVHAGREEAAPIEDLRRARAAAETADWIAAEALAEQLQAGDLLRAGLLLVDAPGGRADTRRARLRVDGAPSLALSWQALLELPWHRRPFAFAREGVPSAAFLRATYPESASRRFGLLRAYLRRCADLLGQVPGAVRAWRASR